MTCLKREEVQTSCSIHGCSGSGRSEKLALWVHYTPHNMHYNSLNSPHKSKEERITLCLPITKMSPWPLHHMCLPLTLPLLCPHLHPQLEAKREEQLKDMGFNFVLRVVCDWDARYREVLEHRMQQGHCLFAKNTTSGKSLAQWVYLQRGRWRSSCRGVADVCERALKLEACGIAVRKAARWEDYYRRLLLMKLHNGHLRVEMGRDVGMATWMARQRQLFKMFKQGPDKVAPVLDLTAPLRPKGPTAPQLHTCTRIHTYIHTYIHTHAHAHTHTNTHGHTHTHTHEHIHTKESQQATIDRFDSGNDFDSAASNGTKMPAILGTHESIESYVLSLAPLLG